MNRATVIRNLKLVGMWIPAILLTLIFVPQGLAKFSDTSGWARAFAHWGYPVWFRMTIGVLELSGVALLLSWRWALFGAGIIIVVMLGAMGTHVAFDHGRNMTSEVVPLTLATIALVAHIRMRRRG